MGGGKSQSQTFTLIYNALCSRTGCPLSASSLSNDPMLPGCTRGAVLLCTFRGMAKLPRPCGKRQYYEPTITKNQKIYIHDTNSLFGEIHRESRSFHLLKTCTWLASAVKTAWAAITRTNSPTRSPTKVRRAPPSPTTSLTTFHICLEQNNANVSMGCAFTPLRTLV